MSVRSLASCPPAPISPNDAASEGPVPSGEGSSLWGRMVAATTSLKVNVSTAISNVTREDGEGPH